MNWKKKKASAVAGKLSLCFVTLSWSQGRNVKGGDVQKSSRSSHVIRTDSTASGSKEKNLFLLLRGLLRRLLGRRLLSGLLSHGATTSFQERNVKLGEFVVNDFLASRRKFFDDGFQRAARDSRALSSSRARNEAPRSSDDAKKEREEKCHFDFLLRGFPARLSFAQSRLRGASAVR